MMRSREKKPYLKAVAISFASLDGDPYARARQTGLYLHEPCADPAHWGPTLRAMGDPRSELYGRLSDWYYLCHPIEGGPLRVAGCSAPAVAEDLKRAIAEHVPPEVRPRFEDRTWDTSLPPHDHADLWELVKKELRRVRERHRESEIVLVLSAGTAAMHAVLFLAGSIGLVDGPIRIVQVERGEGARLRPERPVVDVTLKLETVLQIARETVPAWPGADEAASLRFDQAKSPALRRALERARRAARLPFPILLRGERGVGKSTLAKLIRASSPYRQKARDRTWPAVACGQFADPQRLMVELCGSVKGGFTGAETRPGLLALAHEDTLFLDEIHDMSEENQRVMIRLLEDGAYYPVGSSEPAVSKFRLITGTNKPEHDLRSCISPDFYDRIRDIEIEVPPLRDCQADLPWMWAEAWREVARRAQLDPNLLEWEHPSVVNFLQHEALPGNWRDLRRLAVHLTMHFDHQGRLTGKGLPDLLEGFFQGSGAEQARPASLGLPLLPKRQAERLERLEAELGEGLERFWEACASGSPPRVALEHLLGDRHRAARAMKFIPEVFASRWAALAGRTRPSR